MEGYGVQLVDLVELIGKAMLQVHVIIAAVVPGGLDIVGSGILVQSPPRRGVGIQGAPLHPAAVTGSADDVGAGLSVLQRVDHLIFRHHCRIEVCRSSRRKQGRSALSELIHSRDIHRVLRQILQPRNGIAVGGNAFYLLIFAVIVAALFVVQVVGDRILHQLPGYHDALIFPHCGYIVRLVRLFGGLGDRGDGVSVSAAPCAVHRLHPHLVFLIVDQLFAPVGADVQSVLRHHHRLRRIGAHRHDLHLIARDIGTGLP